MPPNSPPPTASPQSIPKTWQRIAGQPGMNGPGCCSHTAGTQGWTSSASRRVGFFKSVMTVFIGASCVTLTLESATLDPDSDLSRVIKVLDIVFAVVFSVEFLFATLAKGVVLPTDSYFRDWWNILDFTAMVASVLAITSFGENTKSLRALRVLRVARLFRLIPRLQVVMLSIIKTLNAFFVMLIPYLFFVLIFAILGLSLFEGLLGQCNDPTVPNRALCTGVTPGGLPRSWSNYRMNYDNFFSSVLSVVVITLQEGWPDDMYRMTDINGIDISPSRDARPYYAVFNVIGEFLGFYFFLSVLTGVVVDNLTFNMQKVQGLDKLNDKQQAWLRAHRSILNSKPKILPPPVTNAFREKCCIIAKAMFKKKVMIRIVVLNLLVMAADFYDSPTSFQTFLFIMEILFTIIYAIEALILLIALYPKAYFADRWNCLSLFIVIVGLVGIIAGQRGGAVAVLRLPRAIRLVEHATGLRTLQRTLHGAAAHLLNVAFLMLLFYYVFAVFAMSVFGRLNLQNAQFLNEHINFETFPKAFLTVFVLSTGEDWPGVMHDMMMRPPDCNFDDDNCGYQWAPAYMLLLQFFVNLMLVNTITAITVKTFQEMMRWNDSITYRRGLMLKWSENWTHLAGSTRWMDAPLVIVFLRTLPAPLLHGRRPNAPRELATLVADVPVFNNRVGYVHMMYPVFYQWAGCDLPDHLLDPLLKRQRNKPECKEAEGVEAHPYQLVYATITIQRVFRGHTQRTQSARRHPSLLPQGSAG
eukprot:NODE_152_length_2907_cov_17.045324_g140_i0.p1 GENE.NODE_152_length_2907_cov_17.045324_g140_i0~~NODE_152_length_2907_cov_17.045324_g140_i0.p1  ORF type:complete len:754 (-),score=222.21 NODE_152_length_2907_cov_17.045324_g140_i0:44-2305(-)